MTTLVIGGAGYIGSHVSKLLAKTGETVIVFDNLSTGHIQLVRWSEFVFGDTKNKPDLAKVFDTYEIDTVMHLGDLSIVRDSAIHPELYYKNNILGLLNILECMKEYSVNRIIYSSSAAVYGSHSSKEKELEEDHHTAPTTAYGKTKLAGESLIDDFFSAHDVASVSLRYFNAAGADLDTEIGEFHDNETHLIPSILIGLIGTNHHFKVYGNDYNTADGTCIRDYVHVSDIAQAHILASNYLDHKAGAFKFNLGTSQGASVMEVIKVCENVTGMSVPFEIAPRRPGDPSVLIANSASAKKQLNWEPHYSDLETIVQTAWKWYLKSYRDHIPIKVA